MQNLTVTQILSGIKNKKFSCEEITKYYIDKSIKDQNDENGINAFINILEEYSIKTAKQNDEKINKGDITPLAGLPIALKDNINVKSVETTCGSNILRGYLASYDAFVTQKLKNAGSIITGKLNMDEFAMGSSCETSYFGTTKNPHDKTRIPGGSSGGAAAAVAADLIPASLGSDTGGSIRMPASLCGVVGLKTTYGRVSRNGLVAYGSSLDQIGPITKTVADSALILHTIAGYDKNDSTSIDIPVEDYLNEIEKDIKGKKIGLPKEYFTQGMEDDVKKATMNAVEKLKDLGCEIVDISLPHTKYGVPVYYIIAPSEASSNLARFDGIRYGNRAKADGLLETFMKTREQGFGEEVKRRILLGTYSLSSGYYDAYYLKALQVRTLIKNDFVNAFNNVDLIVAPVSPTPAFKIGEKTDDPVKMYLSDIYTITSNLAGVPALSVPVSKNEQGLPIGVQFIGKHFDEKTLFNVGHKFEQAIEYDYKI